MHGVARRPGRPKLGRNFGLLWSGSVISLVGTVNTTVAVPLVALMLTGSAFDAGLTGFAGTLPRLVMHIPAGFIADRVDRRKVLAFAQLGRFVVAVSVGFALLSGNCTIEWLIVGVVLEGSFAAFFEIAEMSIVSQVVRRDDLDEASARNEGRNFVATLSGRPLGGALSALGAGFPFFAAAGALLVSTGLFYRLGRRDPLVPLPPRDRTTGFRRRALVGFGILRDDPLLRRTVAICALTNFLFQVVTLDMIVMARQDQVSPALVGVLLAASGVGGLLGASFAPRLLGWLKQPGRAVSACVISWWFALCLFAAVHHPLGWLLAWAAVGFTGSQMSVLRGTYQATVVRPEWQGLVSGFNQFLTHGAVFPLAHIFGGGAIEALGPTTIAVATAGTATALLVLNIARGWHNLQWSDQSLHKPGQAPLCREGSDRSIGPWLSGSALSRRSSPARVPS
ncbi:MFS transporter [Microbispora catharanthi]|uniref:MFS transporter n=1 Tax=Microbispora catharanthi TaxID=1712871 RepID=A0A5N6BVM4_9ACTN|nr:MFS transporter [Microbispora catharanthi]KAB8184546.1 MFS transporter [Microbispora catharanthi]